MRSLPAGWRAGCAATLVAALVCPAVASGRTAPEASTDADACDRGAALLRVGRYEAAASAYLKGLETETSLRCSSEALARLGRYENLCATAKALQTVGRTEEAHKAYLKVLEGVPSSRCARDGAAATDPRDVWNWLGGAIKDVGNLLVAIAFLALLGAVAISGLVRVAARSKRLRDKRLVRWLRRPLIQLDGLDDSAVEKLGPATTAVFRQKFAESTGTGRHLDLVSAETSTADAFGGLSGVSPPAAAAAALLHLVRSLTPRASWRVSGELQEAGDSGYGLTIALKKGRRYGSFASFWAARDAGPSQPKPHDVAPSAAETLRRLTIPAAAWLSYHHADDLHPHTRLTNDAMSWALFATGVHWQDQAERESARSNYQRALVIDQGNIGALLNLGIALGEESKYDHAERLLSEALRLLEDDAMRPAVPFNGNWYRAKYSLATMHANRVVELGQGAARAEAKTQSRPRRRRRQRAMQGIAEAREKIAAEAKKQAEELVLRSIEARAELAAAPRRHPMRVLECRRKKSRARCEPFVRLLRARRGLSRAQCKQLERLLRVGMEPSGLVLYAARLEHSQTAPDGGSYENVVQELKSDKPNPAVLIAYVLTVEGRAPHVDYNLACLYAEWRDWESAAELARASVERTPALQRPRRIEQIKGEMTLRALWSTVPGERLQKWLAEFH